MDGKNAQGYAAATVQSLIIGFSFMFVVIALRSTSALDLLAFRFGIAFFVASIPVVLGKWRPRVNLRDLALIVPLAIFYPVLFFLLQTWGLLHTPSSEAGIIQATIPVFTLILAALFLGETTRTAQKFFVALSVGGVIFVSAMNGVGQTEYDFVGLALILGSTLSIAIYNVLARTLARKYPLFTLTYIMTALAFVVFLSASLIDHALKGDISGYFAPLARPDFLVAVLYLGILSSLLTSYLANFALARIEASKMGVFSNLSVVMTIFAGFFFLGETLFWYHGLAAVMIVAGVFGTNYFGKKRAA